MSLFRSKGKASKAPTNSLSLPSNSDLMVTALRDTEMQAVRRESASRMPPIIGFNRGKMPKPNFSLSDLPGGWLSGIDAIMLFLGASSVSGPILEVGSWIGRSTCAIAYGVKRQHNTSGSLTRFDVVDFGIAGTKEWRTRIGGDPEGLVEADDIIKIINGPAGVLGALKDNLVKRDLSQFVQSIYAGDILHYRSDCLYDMMFCDVAANANEIERNLKSLTSLVNTTDNFLVFDDVISDDRAQLILQSFPGSVVCMTRKTDEHSKLLVIANGRYTALL